MRTWGQTRIWLAAKSQAKCLTDITFARFEQNENILIDRLAAIVHILGFTPRWNGTLPLHFTPGQLRETVGLSVETFRHWKRVLPPFFERAGRTPRYLIGDL